MRSLKRLPDSRLKLTGGERGQILLVVALAMIGLLIAAGLAVDVGVLLMRKAQLDRAVDAAALAGAPELPNGLPSAHSRGMQMLATNGIVVTNAANPPTCPSPIGTYWTTNGYCGSQSSGSLPGALRYSVEAHWPVKLFFMPLIGFNNIPVISTSQAEYFSVVDTYASGNDQGLVQTANTELFGPSQCTGFGDPYTPTTTVGGGANTWYGELNGAYTYRIAIPTSYPFNKVRVELFDPSTANVATTSTTVYKSNGTPVTVSACGSQWDPCLKATGDSNNPYWFFRMDENRGAGCPNSTSAYTATDNTETLFRLYYYTQSTAGNLQAVDLAYYRGRKDVGADLTEAQSTTLTWVSPGASASERMPAFTTADNLFSGLDMTAEPATTTEVCNTYRAAHYGTVVDSTHYTDATQCQGNGDFIVDLTSETPGIYVDPNSGVRHLYLQVRGLSGSSENNFALWAGPALSDDPTVKAPADVNTRQIYIVRQKAASPSVIAHSSKGIVTYGMGHLPMNSDTGSRVRFPLAYLGPEFSGLPMTIQLFDADSGTCPPLIFYFDTVAQTDWSACFGVNLAQCVNEGSGNFSWQYLGTPNNFGSTGCTSPNNGGPYGTPNNTWGVYNFTVPSELDPSHPVPFYGGRLMVDYMGGSTDTFGWKLTVKARPTLTH